MISAFCSKYNLSLAGKRGCKSLFSECAAFPAKAGITFSPVFTANRAPNTAAHKSKGALQILFIQTKPAPSDDWLFHSKASAISPGFQYLGVSENWSPADFSNPTGPHPSFIKKYWPECRFSVICVSSPPPSYYQNDIQKIGPVFTTRPTCLPVTKKISPFHRIRQAI